MQAEPAERRRQHVKGRHGERQQGRVELKGTQQRALRNTQEEIVRLKEIFTTMQEQRQTSAGDRDGRAGRDDEEGGRDRSRGDGGRVGEKEEVRGRRAASEGGQEGDQSESLRRRVHQLERERLELTASHNQELCRLQTELTRLRSSVERGEAQREELQYQLTISQRDADRASQLSRDRQALTERAAELQLKVQELQKSLKITRQAREEDQNALQQEVEERDKLIQNFGSENERLHRLLQDQEEALEESERRIMEALKEKEKEEEVIRRQAEEMKDLKEREERSRKEKEFSDERFKSLESNMEAERVAHLESKFNSQLIQLRVRDLEAAVAAERSGQQEAQSTLELLRVQFREVERAYSAERERRGSTERALERSQKEFEQRESELHVTLETERKVTSDLRESLEEEKKQHINTKTQLEQVSQRVFDSEESSVNFLRHIRESLKQHNRTGESPPAKHDGNLSPSAEVMELLKTTLSRLETAEKQVQDLRLASERLQEEKRTLRQLTSDQSRQMEESRRKSVRLEEEVTRLQRESSDWSIKSRGLQAELEKEREEREREREGEKEERRAEVQQMMERHQEESKARLSFLYRLYQRLLAGCVLLDQPQSILGNFTWVELCDVISEQVDQLTSDLREAKDKIAHLQRACQKKSVCVRELQRSQECVLSRLEESVRRREEAWSHRHTQTVTELQLCRSHCDSLRDHASSLKLRLSSLTSDLSRRTKESSSFLSACALLGGALKHTHRRLLTLRSQKALLSRRLAEREELEEEVRRLAGALGGEDGEEEEKRRRRRTAVRRWRKSVWAVLAVRRWCVLANQTTVLLQVERGGGASVCVCGETSTGAEEGQEEPNSGPDVVFLSRRLRSDRLSAIILSCSTDLQEALTHSGMMSAAQSTLSRLLDHLLDQSDSEESSLKISVDKKTTARSDGKALVATLQQHFLLFTQQLHSAEVERRSLRLEVTNLKRGMRREKKTCGTVPVQRFQRVCEELRQALIREEEVQTLLQEHTHYTHT
ncbi:Hypothetical predicted protein [Xyrichtys novacula]|uniref:Uncharacterized protein n=1 Tax=Xyrichtys novacula TaxID=13765 RepID=A0AAV1EHU9_XYRNO|nr:Hypothetical predicted protein [Xyrichtys novacula]